MTIRALQRAIRTVLTAGLLAISACTMDSGISTDIRFNPAEAQATNEGLLVVGMRLIREPTANSLLFGSHKAAAWFLMSFIGVDGTNHFTPVRRSVQLCDITRTAFGGVGSSCDPTLTAYRVIKVPAGRYVLSNFALHEDKLVMNTNFVGAPERLPLAGMHQVPTGAPPTLAAFDVPPGQITYIGDFNWDPEVFPARFSMSRSDGAAASALTPYAQVSAPFVFRPIMLEPVTNYPTAPSG